MSLVALVAVVAIGGVEGLGLGMEESIVGNTDGDRPGDMGAFGGAAGGGPAIELGSQAHADTSLINYNNNSDGRARAEAYMNEFCNGNGIDCQVSENGGYLMVSTSSDDIGALRGMGAQNDIYGVAGPAGAVVASTSGAGTHDSGDGHHDGDGHDHGDFFAAPADVADAQGGGDTVGGNAEGNGAGGDGAGNGDGAGEGPADGGRTRAQLVTDFRTFATALLSNTEGEDIAEAAFGGMRPGEDPRGLPDHLTGEKYSDYSYEELAAMRGELHLAMDALEASISALDGNEGLTDRERDILREELEEQLKALEERDADMRSAQAPNFDEAYGFNTSILSLLGFDSTSGQSLLQAYVDQLQGLADTHTERKADRETFFDLQSQREAVADQIRALESSGAEGAEYAALQEQLAGIDALLVGIETRDADRAEQQSEDGASIVMPALEIDGELGPVGPDVGDWAAVASYLEQPVARIGNAELAFPVDTQAFRYTSDFGPRDAPCSTCSSYHQGTDIGPEVPGTTGVRLLAAHDGVVVNTHHADDNSGGLYVVVQRDDGLVTKYLHMAPNSITVQEGQRVNAGDHLGEMGTTGSSTGIHLHFTVEINGQKVNPAPFIGLPEQTSGVACTVANGC